MTNILSEKDSKVVADILIRELGIERSQLTPYAQLNKDLGADSLTIVEISMALEEHFNLSIPDECWENVRTVGDVCEALADMLQKQGRP
jgi:acyl carrier protein